MDKAVCGKTLDPDYDNIIDNFVSSYRIIHSMFGANFTNKFHIIESHLKTYFNTTKKSLGYYTDQLIEAMHQHAESVFSDSNYNVKDLSSDKHGEKLLAGVHHLNSYNLI